MPLTTEERAILLQRSLATAVNTIEVLHAQQARSDDFRKMANATVLMLGVFGLVFVILAGIVSYRLERAETRLDYLRGQLHECRGAIHEAYRP